MENKKMVIKLLAALFLSAMICVLNTDLCYRWFSMHLCSPESYYHATVSRELKRCMESAEKFYIPLRESLTGDGKPRRLICRVEPGDTLKALYGNQGLKSASLILDGERDGAEVMGQAVLQINDQDALHAKGYLNYGEQYGHVQIPGLSKAYLTLGQLLKQKLNDASPGDRYLFSMMGDADSFLPRIEDLSALSEKYPTLILGQEDTVTREHRQLQTGGIRTSCTQYTAFYSGESCYQICQNLLERLEQDSGTLAQGMEKELQEHAPKITWEMERDMRKKGETQTPLEKQLELVNNGYQAATDFLQEKQEAPVTHKEQFLAKESGLTVQMWVDFLGNILGRSIYINVGGQTVSVRQLIVWDGRKFGCEMSVKINDITYLQIKGNGSVRRKKLSGDFDLPALWQKQELQGELEISTERISAWKNYRLRISLENLGEQNNIPIQIMTGKTVFATVNLQWEAGKTPDIGERKDYDGEKNSYRLSDLGELADYASEVNLEQILQKIEEDCGIKLGF